MQRIIVHTALLLIVVLIAACNGGVGADEKAKVAAIAELPRMDYSRGGVNFSLAQFEGLRQVHKDSVAWAQYMVETEENGQLGYYFYPGFAHDLSSPQIRVEYMSKSLPGCSTVDSLFTWLKSLYVGNERNGSVVGEEQVATVGGDPIKVLEIAIPTYVVDDTTQYSEKHMAWAYADQGSRFVGFSYSATTKDDYKQGVDLFKDLVRSYKGNE